MHCFYVLQSSKDGDYYYGSTSDPETRVRDHNAGRVTSTKARRPLDLVYYEAYQSHQKALEREKTVKRSGTARDALKKRI